eukprot:CAMPEP_0113682250 /NCGR_PEP_ID=MMETSP0038_2-20120614/12532_1 /TAXON_ID=2898 /ORGANISM="Cryptomonas paramecium" /LENGTH=111 /DNA_ID=CAMNT_0000601245 /DNA_START=276 /DNA_END=612 /DNA_ORIENTATION=+ /assembly_acc=CAM_ASM_000170
MTARGRGLATTARPLTARHAKMNAPAAPERLPPDGVSTTLVAVKQLRNTPRPHTPRTNREVVGGAGPKVAHALGEHVAEVHHVVARGRRGPSHGDHVGEEGVGLRAGGGVG